MGIFLKKKSVLSVAACMALVACGGDDGDGKGPIEEGKDAIGNLAKNKDIPGTAWESGCASIDFGFDAGVSAKQTWTFSATNNNVTRSFVIYGEADCNKAIGDLEILGSYRLKDSDDSKENPVDLEFNKVFLTAQTQDFVDALKGVTWCGTGEWSKDSKIEVTEVVGQGLCQPPVALDKTNYDRIRIDGETMYLGSPFTQAPTDEGNRPTTVNEDVKFDKRGR